MAELAFLTLTWLYIYWSATFTTVFFMMKGSFLFVLPFLFVIICSVVLLVTHIVIKSEMKVTLEETLKANLHLIIDMMDDIQWIR